MADQRQQEQQDEDHPMWCPSALAGVESDCSTADASASSSGVAVESGLQTTVTEAAHGDHEVLGLLKSNHPEEEGEYKEKEKGSSDGSECVGAALQSDGAPLDAPFVPISTPRQVTLQVDVLGLIKAAVQRAGRVSGVDGDEPLGDLHVRWSKHDDAGGGEVVGGAPSGCKSLEFESFNLAISATEVTPWETRKAKLTAGDVWRFVEGVIAQHRAYTMAEVQGEGFNYVSVLEKKALLDLLTGNDDESQQRREPHLVNASVIDVCSPVRLIHMVELERVAGSSHLATQWSSMVEVEVGGLLIRPGGGSRSRAWRSLQDILKRPHVLPPYFHPVAKIHVSEEGESSHVLLLNAPIVQACCPGRDFHFVLNAASQLDFSGKAPAALSALERNTVPAANKDRRTAMTPNTEQWRTHRGGAQHQGAAHGGDRLPAAAVKKRRLLPPGSSLLQDLRAHRLTPTIILPSGVCSGTCLTMHNAKDFFLHKTLRLGGDNTFTEAQGEFIWEFHMDVACSVAARRRTFEGEREEKEVVRIRVVDAPQAARFTRHDWYGVVATFVTGAEWQIANWPFRDTEDLFTILKGFHFTLDSDEVPPSVRKWRIEVLRAQRAYRHPDAVAWQQMVTSLANFLEMPRDFKKFDREALMKMQRKRN